LSKAVKKTSFQKMARNKHAKYYAYHLGNKNWGYICLLFAHLAITARSEGAEKLRVGIAAEI
jgi:hypothetical protein